MILVLVLLTIIFFAPSFGSWLFIVVTVLLELWIMLLQDRKIKNNGKYSSSEIEIIERYNVFFQYPITSRKLSRIFSGIQLSTFVFVPYMFILGNWIAGIIGVIQYFVVSQFAVTLNPQHFLNENMKNDNIKDFSFKMKVGTDLLALNSALEKMYRRSSGELKK